MKTIDLGQKLTTRKPILSHALPNQAARPRRKVAQVENTPTPRQTATTLTPRRLYLQSKITEKKQPTKPILKPATTRSLKAETQPTTHGVCITSKETKCARNEASKLSRRDPSDLRFCNSEGKFMKNKED
jgi:hypothetical protein